MKTINFRGITESLSEKELKNVTGGAIFCCKCPDGTVENYAGAGDCQLACANGSPGFMLQCDSEQD